MWVRLPPLVRWNNGGLAQLARAFALHAKGRGFDSLILHIVMIRKNDGTDAKNEMETWACPDTNRTDITTLLKNKNYEIRRMENSIPRRKTKVLGK